MMAKYCTGCGRALKAKGGVPCTELYDQELYAKSRILKLVGCADCGLQVADKYVECDGVVLLIDLVLQSKQAYRHVLLNGRKYYTSLVVKMALLTVLCDGYIGWSNTAGKEEFFEQEYEFYITCSKVILALLGFLATVSAITRMNCGSAATAGDKSSRGQALVFGLLLSYSSRFFNLMALLWSSPTVVPSSNVGVTNPAPSSYLIWGFVYLLFAVSSVRVHQVTQETRSAFSSWIHLFMGHLVFVCLLNMDQIIEEHISCSS